MSAWDACECWACMSGGCMHFRSGLGVSELCESEWVGDMCGVSVCVSVWCVYGGRGGGEIEE